jgi:hypothetical protein
MNLAIAERVLALIGALVVGGTASFQLWNEWPVKGLDSTVTKVLLGLMIIGCVFALLGALTIMGGPLAVEAAK